MGISGISSVTTIAPQTTTPAKAEAANSDLADKVAAVSAPTANQTSKPESSRDGDSDDAAASPPVQAAPRPGTGAVVNRTA